MAERQYMAMTYIVENHCEHCKEGAYRSAKLVMCENGEPAYIHNCNVCGAIEQFPDKYPKIVHKRVDGKGT